MNTPFEEKETLYHITSKEFYHNHLEVTPNYSTLKQSIDALLNNEECSSEVVYLEIQDFDHNMDEVHTNIGLTIDNVLELRNCLSKVLEYYDSRTNK